MKRLSILILLISFYSIQAAAQDTVMNNSRGYHVEIGDAVPEMFLILTSGDTLRMRELEGNVVVLQFTASWCSVCRKEMPHLENEIWLPNKDKNFILIGVDYDEPLNKVNEFAQQMNITYPMALDPGGKHFNQFAYPKSGVTRNVVIDQEGKIVFLTRLFNKKEFEEMKQVINDLLNR